MGVAAHNGVNAHVAELLGHGLLVLVGGKLVFLTPVHIYQGGLRACGLHFVQIGLGQGVEFRQLVIGEVAE